MKEETMESLGDILKKLTQKNTSDGQTNTLDSKETKVENSAKCSICKDTGWVRKDVQIGHPSFGKAFPCRCQEDQVSKDRQEGLYRYSNLKNLARFNFSNLVNPKYDRDARNEKIFQETLKAAKNFTENPSGWIVFCGPSGSGKTHLAGAIANDQIKHDRIALFVSVPDLLDHLRSAFSPTAEVFYDELFEQVRNTPLLILDDLGSQNSTPWAIEKLFQILNHRYNLSLATVITTATPIDYLEDRWRTRLNDPQLSQVHQIGEWDTLPSSKVNLGAPEPKLVKAMTFDSFNINGNNADLGGRHSLEAALKAAMEFAKEPKGWLVLLGPNGCGKTHLSIAVHSARVKNGASPFYTFVPDFLDHLRSSFNPESLVKYDQLFEHVKYVDLLILDGLGSERASTWAEEKLNQIIVHRHSAELPTIITTTRQIDELRESISSRLKDIHLVALHPIGAPDYRDSSRTKSNAKRFKDLK
jgi:DNA replication protein DnaC